MAIAPVLAANALTTIERVKLFSPASAEIPADADPAITMLINAASAWIEGQLDRKLGKASYSDHLQSTGRQWLLLSQWPIVAVKTITQAGQYISKRTFLVEPDGYAGCLYKDDGWTWMGYHQGLAYDPIAASRNIAVNYVAGYVLPKDATDDEPQTLPHDLEMLCIEMVMRVMGKVSNGGMAGLKSFAISDVRWEWDNEIPQTWEYVINAHRRGWS